MEFYLQVADNAYPCVVTIDEDNGRYMIKKSDSSGEVFNSPKELIVWIYQNWEAEHFLDKVEFNSMLREIQSCFPISP